MKEINLLNVKRIAKRLLSFIQRFFKKIGVDDAFSLAAALAYYAVFSMAPFLYIVINALGLLYNEEKVRKALFGGLVELVGEKGAGQLEASLVNMGITQAGWFQNIIGVVLLFFTATTIFAAIQRGLNFVFRVKSKGTIGILEIVKTRLMAFSIIIGIALISLFSLVANGMVALFSDWIISLLPQLKYVLYSLNSFFFPFMISWLVFLIIFRFLPDATAKWFDLIIGSLFTALLFAIGRYLIGFYIGKSDIANIYDAAGSIMVIFIWMYYSSFIFYLGAIFTVLYAEEFGGGIKVQVDSIRFKYREVKSEDKI